MAYTPKVWQTGEVITANDLNHLEDGVNAALTTFKINVTYNWQTEEATCDKTFAQIKEAYENNYNLVIGKLTQINREGQDTDTATVNFTLNNHFPEDVEQGWDESFEFHGFCYSNFSGSTEEFFIYINGDESTSVSVSDLTFVHPVYINFGLDNNNTYSLIDISRGDTAEITLEEYLDGEFSQYTATVVDSNSSQRYLVVLEPTSFLDFRLSQNAQSVSVKDLEFVNIVINNDGTVSQYTVSSSQSN